MRFIKIGPLVIAASFLALSNSYALSPEKKTYENNTQNSESRERPANSPELAGAYNERGLSYTAKGNLNRAIADFNKAIEIAPDYGDAYNNRAVVYYMKGDFNKSWADVHQAESLGSVPHPDFLKSLKKRSGMEK